MSGPTVKMLTYPALNLACPECEKQEQHSTIVLKHRGGGTHIGACPTCGLRMQADTIIERAKTT